MLNIPDPEYFYRAGTNMCEHILPISRARLQDLWISQISRVLLHTDFRCTSQVPYHFIKLLLLSSKLRNLKEDEATRESEAE